MGAAVKRLALLMDEIGWSTRLAELSEPQVRALIEEAVEGFREAMADIAAAQAAQQPRIPFTSTHRRPFSGKAIKRFPSQMAAVTRRIPITPAMPFSIK